MPTKITGIDQAQQIRENMQRVHAFYRNHPVGLCLKCGKQSRQVSAGNGSCLNCTMDLSYKDAD